MVDFRHRPFAGLMLAALCACVLCLLPFSSRTHSDFELLDAKSTTRSVVAEQNPSDRTVLLKKMRSLLQVQAFIAAAAMKDKKHELKEKMRSDWKPYDPTKSLAENRALNPESAWGSREDELKPAKKTLSAEHNHDGADYARYEAKMHHLHGHAPCKNWGNHPIDCIREAYKNQLAGTKFATLQRKYDGRVTDDSLKRERAIIDKKVGTGLLSGQLPVPKHGAVHRWVAKQEAARRAAEKAALDAAVRKATAAEQRRLARAAVAKDWGSARATEGPDAGRRYYINYRTHSTTWDAPAAVKRALKVERLAAKAAALRGAVRESQLYEEGFRAGAGGEEAAQAPAGMRPAAAVQVLAAERRAADQALSRFLEKEDGVKHAFQLPHSSPSNVDLAGERQRIAKLLGVEHLVRKDPEDEMLHVLQHVPAALAAAVAPRRESLGLVPAPVQSKVIVDAWGHPVTSRPEATDYPTGQPALPAPSAVQGQAPSAAPAASSTAPAEANQAAAAVVKAYEAEAEAANAKAAALQEEVAVQKALIDDLERRMGGQPAAVVAAAAAEPAAAVPLPAVVKAASKEGAASPALGSFEMADFANSDEGGMMGTDVAYLSGSPYLAEAKQAPAAAAAAPTTGADEAVKALEQDAARLAADRARAAADAAAARSGELGTIGAAAAVPLTGEAGADETALPVAAMSDNAAPAAEGSAAAAEEVATGEDEKPELGSWEMAKFANNVEAGGGSLGTNVAWMYDSLAKRGHYHDVEQESAGGNDDGFMEYKAAQPTTALASAPANGAAAAALSEEAGRLSAEVNRRQGGPISI